MANKYFQFKEFIIYHDQCGMKVGTDGVLLGAWANVSGSDYILDIGTGTGLIAIMMAQRTSAKIDAVEIDQAAYRQALQNVSKCKWKDRIDIYDQSFQKFSKLQQERYDLIITNPPYFVNALQAPDKKRTHARHAHSLNFDDILNGSKKLLKETGRLSLILPFSEGMKFQERASTYDLFCIRKTHIKPLPDKDPKRLLMEFSPKKEPLTEDYLVIENNKRHHYTQEYKELTKKFYLYF